MINVLGNSLHTVDIPQINYNNTNMFGSWPFQKHTTFNAFSLQWKKRQILKSSSTQRYFILVTYSIVEPGDKSGDIIFTLLLLSLSLTNGPFQP